MKFRLTLNKEFEIDTDKYWDGDLSQLIEQLKRGGKEPGEVANSGEIADAIREMLAEDFDQVLDLDLDETDFVVTVPSSTTLEIPEEEEDDE